MTTSDDTAATFLDVSRAYLAGEYMSKIERCVDLLDDDEVWWRPNVHSNSVGNLLQHLAGNVRQYLISGVGGAPDTRRRDREFEAAEEASGNELVANLRETVEEADLVLRGLDRSALFAERSIQGRPMTVFEAVFHAVEHFSTHVGQIIYITKLLKDRDLSFYGFEGGVEHRW